MAFADKENPIRCSRLASIARCSGRVWLLDFLDSEDGEGGEAAQTGSLTHAGVAAFHLAEGSLDNRRKEAWNAIAANRAKFPLADETEVRLFITPYMNDPRNIAAEFSRMPDGSKAIEKQVEFTITPHSLDPIKELIYVQGTYDQIRILPNRKPAVFDLKTGKPSPLQMIHDYAVQLAAYTIGAKEFFPDITVGQIIRNYGYRVRGVDSQSPDGVFIALPFQMADIEILLDNIRLHVALMRMDDVQLNPGPHCSYCEFKGLTGCVPRLRAVLNGAKANDPFIQLERK